MQTATKKRVRRTDGRSTDTRRPTETPTSDPVVTRDEQGGVVVRGRSYSLGEISRGSGVARPHITRIFNGKRGLSMSAAQRICGFLGVPIESLLGILNRR